VVIFAAAMRISHHARTWDSIPKLVLESWLAERRQLLRRLGIDEAVEGWQQRIRCLPPSAQSEFHRTVSDRWNDQLDACHGSRALRRPELGSIVAESLHRFNGDRYDLTDFVIMPNHVHLLVAFPNEDAMLKQCESWKHFTATRINRALQRNGRFWQQDGFDHLVRSADALVYFRRYIANNPERARLRTGEYVHYSKSKA
jgi:type I restriction enzyme R subunit